MSSGNPAVDERQPSIGIRHHPCQLRKTSSGVSSRGGRQVDADAGRCALRAHARRERVAGTGAKVCDHGVVRQVQRRQAPNQLADQRPSDSSIEQASPRLDDGDGIAGGQRAAILRLKQIDVPAARDVVGMPARADVRARRIVSRPSGKSAVMRTVQASGGGASEGWQPVHFALMRYGGQPSHEGWLATRAPEDCTGAEVGGRRGDRTRGLRIANAALSQLS